MKKSQIQLNEITFSASDSLYIPPRAIPIKTDLTFSTVKRGLSMDKPLLTVETTGRQIKAD